MGAENNHQNPNYQRLFELNQKVTNNSASKTEKDELMLLLYNNSSITKKQYDDYIAGRNTEDILHAALIIAGIVLLGSFLNKILK